MSEQTALFDAGGVRTISNRAFAELVGVSEGTIRKAIIRGEITAVVNLPSGKTMLQEEAALQQWRARHPDPDGDTPPADGGGTDYTNARARREAAQADMAEMERDELRGKLHRAEDVEAVWSEHTAAAVSRVGTLKSKLVAILPGDPLANGRLIDDVVNEMRREMSIDPLEYGRAKQRRKKAK